MKRKAKRGLLLMGMAVASGAAFAKETGKAQGDALAYSDAREGVRGAVILPDVAHAAVAKSSELSSQLKSFLGDPAAPAPVSFEPKGWRLEMHRGEGKDGAVDDPRLINGRQVGLALRVKF